MEPEYHFEPNLYESFMRRHLQYYGYFNGQNSKYSDPNDWMTTVQQFDLSSECTDTSTDSEEENEFNKRDPPGFEEEFLKTTQLIFSYSSNGRMVPRLREPRQLYALTTEVGPEQAPRWPSDLHVTESRIRHIHTSPSYLEPMYEPCGLESTPTVRGDIMGSVVYNYEPAATCFERSRVGGTRVQSGTSPSDDDAPPTLQFESRFESGNLAKVIQIRENDYELWLRYDLYTNKHTQWFYFRVTHTRQQCSYRFTIVNFMKGNSLYNMGMRPLMYSEIDAENHGIGWIRAGSDIKYYRNNKVYDSDKGEKSFYSLTWTVKFEYKDDTVYFAHCYPYTYTDLQEYLNGLANDSRISQFCRQRVLCHTLAGNFVYILTVTSPAANPELTKHKKAVVITARVHPGESNASWMMKGLIDYLVGTSLDAQLLRDMFIFKIVPMLNPDGVIVGNYRCSLTGRDLNRSYRTKLKDAFPSVWYTRNMISRLMEERDIVMYCDLHGHSRKQNVFIYGCENQQNPLRRLHERIFPVMLSKNASDKFNFASCKFKIQKSKEGTGRVVMWNMGIVNSFTMEATFCGSTLGRRKMSHFNISDYESMGYHFLDTLLDYCDPDKTKANNILIQLEEKVKLEIMEKLKSKGDHVANIDINTADLSSLLDESSDGGSDSSVSDGLPAHMKFPRMGDNRRVKKKWKTRRERDKIRTKEKIDEASNSPSEKIVQVPPSTSCVPEMNEPTMTLTKSNMKSYSGFNTMPFVCPSQMSTTGNELIARSAYLHDLNDNYTRYGTNLSKQMTSSSHHLKYAIAGRLNAIREQNYTTKNLYRDCINQQPNFAFPAQRYLDRGLRKPLSTQYTIPGSQIHSHADSHKQLSKTSSLPDEWTNSFKKQEIVEDSHNVTTKCIKDAQDNNQKHQTKEDSATDGREETSGTGASLVENSSQLTGNLTHDLQTSSRICLKNGHASGKQCCCFLNIDQSESNMSESMKEAEQIVDQKSEKPTIKYDRPKTTKATSNSNVKSNFISKSASLSKVTTRKSEQCPPSRGKSKPGTSNFMDIKSTLKLAVKESTPSTVSPAKVSLLISREHGKVSKKKTVKAISAASVKSL